MPIDDALEKIKKEDDIKKLEEENKKKERELAEARKKAAQDKKQYEKELEEAKKIQENLRELLDAARSGVNQTSSDKQTAVVKAHLEGILQFWPGEPKDELDTRVIKFITHPDFIEAYKNSVMIKDLTLRYNYVIMKAIQTEAVPGLMFPWHEFAQRIAPLGLGLICPYIKEDKTSCTKQKCMLDGGEGIDTTCNGALYTKCMHFSETTAKFITGEITTIKPPKTYKAPEIVIPDNERRNIVHKLEKETEDFWEGED